MIQLPPASLAFVPSPGGCHCPDEEFVDPEGEWAQKQNLKERKETPTKTDRC
jgi:hypothetical protein